MSRSSYSERNNNSTSGPGYDRDYDDRKERERERTRSADRYDSEGRHHGKWTASGEADVLEGQNQMPGAYNDARRSNQAHLGPRSYSDREGYGDYSYNNRSRGSYGNYGDQSYGMSVPPPPPMPPRDFWMPHNQYKNSHPYYPAYGHTSYDGTDLSGAHGEHYQAGRYGHLSRGFDQRSSYGSPYHENYDSYGYGEHIPSYGWFHQGMYGGEEAMLSRDMEYLALQNRSVIPGAHPTALVTPIVGRHLELGTTRPHVDIYEVANEYIIEMDLPGHSREHIETKLFGNELVVTSRPAKRDHQFHINERSLGRHEVTRKFYLPADVNNTKINASLTNGVLRLVLPRSTGVSSVTTPTTTTVVDTSGSTTTTTQTVV